MDDSIELRGGGVGGGEDDDTVVMMVTEDLEAATTDDTPVLEVGGDANSSNTEFHINLDKCPPSLQNTLINEKVYINEHYKSHLDEQGLMIEFDPEKVKELYDSLGLNEGSFDTELGAADKSTDGELTPGVNLSQVFRRDSLHLNGVDELKTQDIFDHFGAYNPYSLEWINDTSCNVVWKSERLLLQALLEATTAYDPSERLEGKRIFMRPPRNIRWRISTQPAVQRRYVNDKQLTRELNHIFVRFVRKHFDRKRKGAEAKSIFYVKYGNPNYGNLKGLISDSKRRNLRQQQLSIINSNLDDAGRVGPIDHELEDAQDVDDGDRKLISYNFELSGFNEIEEFGIGSSPVKTKKPVQPEAAAARRQDNNRRPESRQVFRRDTGGRYKKMYMDEEADQDDDHDNNNRRRRSPNDRLSNRLKDRRHREERRFGDEERPDDDYDDDYTTSKRKHEPRIDPSLRSRLSGLRRESPVRNRSRSRSPHRHDDYESRRKRTSGYSRRRDDFDEKDQDDDDDRYRRRQNSGGPPRSSHVKSVVIAPDDLRNRLSSRKWI